MVNTLVGAGGAAAVVLDLARSFRRRGHGCAVVAGWTVGSTEPALSLPPGYPRLRAAIDWLARSFGHKPFVQRSLAALEQFKQRLEFSLPLHREFDYAGPAGSHRLLAAAPSRPDVVHAHNLHGWYFDLRALPAVAGRAPVVLTLHDAWMLSGHCAHSFDCLRWKTGCGDCPDLSIPVALPFDHSAENWRAKAAIYRRSRLRVATPSRWLLDKVQQSMLRPAVIEGRVIHNGVETAVFRPGDRLGERRALDLPEDAFILLFVANGIRQNIWKDYATLEAAMGRLEVPAGRRVLFIALGEDGPTQRVGDAELRFVPAVAAGEATAAYYHAADLYVHAACADTFPNVVIEALACGTPVVATAVGGIPEQIRSAGGAGADPAFGAADADRATGVLTPAGDAEALAAAISHLCVEPKALARLGRNAARDAAERFDLDRQAGLYLDWFEDIRARWPLERWTNRLGVFRHEPAFPN